MSLFSGLLVIAVSGLCALMYSGIGRMPRPETQPRPWDTKRATTACGFILFLFIGGMYVGLDVAAR